MSATGRPTPPTHLFLYDGTCGLCDRMTQFVLRHDRDGRFHFAALQGAHARDMLGRFHLDATTLTTFYVIDSYLTPTARPLDKGAAAIFVATELGWPWTLLGVLRWLPSALLDAVYGAVARQRYRIFGRYDTCLVPSPEHRARFLDMQ